MKLTIEKCLPKDESEAVKILALSLNDDPGIVFFSPDPIKRSYHTLRMVKSISAILDEYGEKYIIRDKKQIVAVSMWVPPGKQISVLSLIKAGFLFIPFFTGLKTFNRIMKFLDFTSKLQEEHMKGKEHWQLFYLAVHPLYRRKGYGKFILSNILTMAQKDKTLVFLQTFTKDGLNFFKKSGFKLISETIFSPECVMRCMIKDFSAAPQKKKKIIKKPK